MLPEAKVSHQSAKRLRIKIPSKKGDGNYFQRLGEKLVKYKDFEVLQLNPLTGSVLFIDEGLDVDGIEAYAGENGLFDLRRTALPSVPLSRRIAEPLGDTSAFLSRTTGGFLDLPGAAFLLLLGVGLVEIVRGNFRTPPWYTAFWYAFGVFTKSIVDKASKKEEAR
jgi:hypothetical protein